MKAALADDRVSVAGETAAPNVAPSRGKGEFYGDR